MRASRQRGFTLLELMIVVALVAIIASMAFNAFSESGTDTRRARGMADIQAVNDAMARYYQLNFSYTGATLGGLQAASTLNLSPEYDFTVTPGADGQSYSIRAVPSATGSQVGDGAMQMTNTGSRCYYPENDAPNWNTCPHSF